MVENAASVDNSIYHLLGERWYDADDDPVALLRAESRLRNPWVARNLRQHHGPQASILDLGCGGGFLTNSLALEGFRVVGLDASPESLLVARTHDETRAVDYIAGDALNLPFAASTFDAVSAMDLLEHVEQPQRVILEVSRVLRPGGTFFFHTFNRNWLSWLVVIKGVEWCVRNTPPNMHVLRFFIRPREIRQFCEYASMDVIEIQGNAPVFWSWPFWRMLRTGLVPDDLCFQFGKSLLLGYTGFARLTQRAQQLHAE